MARRQGFLDDLLIFGSKLPWRVAVFSAVVAFAGFPLGRRRRPRARSPDGPVRSICTHRALAQVKCGQPFRHTQNSLGHATGDF